MKFDISKSMTIKLSAELPQEPVFNPKYRRAPDRGYTLNESETIIAVKNALRYIPDELRTIILWMEIAV